MPSSSRPEIRNVAVIAHVDHGKTSLVNSMMQEAGLVHVKFGKGGFTLDSMTGKPLEREKGVTILSVITWSSAESSIPRRTLGAWPGSRSE